MSHNGLRLSVLGVALLLIAGCGGGSNAGSNSGGSGGGTGGSGGSGGGSGDQPTTVTFSFISGTPTLVAVKVGSGNYTLENPTSNKLTISVPSGTTTYSVAYLCPPFQQEPNDMLELEFIQFESIQDGTAVDGICPGQVNGTTPTMGNLTGTMDASAFPTAASAEFYVSTPSYGQATSVPLIQGQPAGGSFLVSAPTESDRVLMGLYDSSYSNLLAMKNFNNQTVPGTLNGGTVTFSSADATTLQPITFANLPNGYGTPNTNVSVNGAFTLESAAATQYPQLPAGVLQSGDYYAFRSSSSPSSGPSTVGSFLYPTSGGPVTLSFPAPWSTAGPAPASLPTFVFDYTGYAGKSGVLSEGSYTWTRSNGNQDEILVSATQNYLGNATSLSVPDLSGVSGFLTPPPSGTTNVAWFEYIYQGTFPSTSSPAGGSETYVSSYGSYTMP
jgi:hypothetical protein